MSKASSPVKESSPLIESKTAPRRADEEHGRQEGTSGDNSSYSQLASNSQTALNLVKTCMGSGCLALPLAYKQGGLILFTGGLFGIALWNVCAVYLLIDCKAYLSNSASVATTASTSTSATITVLNQVAHQAYGSLGVFVADIVMMSLFVGVITAYFCAILTFWADTPFSMGLWGNAFWTWLIVLVVSSVPHVGALKHVSAVGLGVLFLAFAVIFGYGISHAVHPNKMEFPSVPLWPTSMDGVSQLFGVIVFGFGIVPMTYNYHSSMQRPQDMVAVTFRALVSTACIYFLAGWSLYHLFPRLEGDILSELPSTGIVPTLTRMAMVVVLVLTAPLLVVPCAELVSEKSQLLSPGMIRSMVCGMACLLAISYPDFVQALSLVGATCASTVSFVLPPLLHWKLSGNTLQDGVLLLIGVFVTVASTYILVVQQQDAQQV